MAGQAAALALRGPRLCEYSAVRRDCKKPAALVLPRNQGDARPWHLSQAAPPILRRWDRLQLLAPKSTQVHDYLL